MVDDDRPAFGRAREAIGINTSVNLNVTITIES
jgi:hypothetical protein